MGCAESSAVASWKARPPAPPCQSESGEVTDVLGDARLLADYTVFLLEQRAAKELGHLWTLELLREEEDEVGEACQTLADSWRAYQASPTGRGNFDDTQEWESHALPSKDVCHRVGSKELVDEEDDHYMFAVAAMVGLHVAAVCSAIIDSCRKDPTAFGDAYDELLVQNSRRYKIPVSGSAYSPKLILSEPFEIEEFAPTMFAALRGLSGVSNADYMDSLCRIDFEFIKFGSNSKSKEFFFFSHDMKYLLKTATQGEAETLLEMAVAMRDRLEEEPRSMLGRYLGLYRLTMGGRSRIFFVMRAIPAVKVPSSRVYDLKGSSRNRTAKGSEPVGKDMNFRREVGRLNLTPDVAKDLVSIHKRDLELLKEYEIMDYSILLHIHTRSSDAADDGDSLGDRDGVPMVSLRGADAFRDDDGAAAAAAASEGGLRQAGQQNGAASSSTTAGAAGGHGVTLSRAPLSRSVSDEMPKFAPWLERVVSLKLLPSTSMGPGSPHDPHMGIVSADGLQTYYFGIIDCLVAYTAYPKAQYAGTQVITCGRADEASRIPPASYASRQCEMFAQVCGTAKTARRHLKTSCCKHRDVHHEAPRGLCGGCEGGSEDDVAAPPADSRLSESEEDE